MSVRCVLYVRESKNRNFLEAKLHWEKRYNLENDCNQVSIWVGLMTIFIVSCETI